MRSNQVKPWRAQPQPCRFISGSARGSASTKAGWMRPRVAALCQIGRVNVACGDRQGPSVSKHDRCQREVLSRPLFGNVALVSYPLRQGR